MKYKMLVMDMDDTLLRHDLSISQKNIESIKKAQDLGVKVILASGRPDCAMNYYASKLDIDKNESYIISYNGAIISESKTKKIIFKKFLKSEHAKLLYKISKRNNVFIHTYEEKKIVTPQNNEYTEIESQITGMDVVEQEKKFENFLENDVVKILMLEKPEKLSELEENLKPHLTNDLTMFTSKPYFLEFMNKDVDKGKAVERLAEQLNIKREEVICMGDSYNDLSMIKYAGLGVAMGNAPDDIKNQSDYIAPTNMDDGVAYVIEKFIL